MKVLHGCKIFAWKIRLCFEKTFVIIKKPLLAENVLDQGKTLACRKTFACGKRIWWSENFSLWETSLMKENLGLWKPSLMNGISLLEENFLDEGKILACGRKLPWSRKILCLWKTYLIKEKPWLVESFLDERNIFSWGKLPWWRKNLGL